jgi:hypothetical protein
MSSAQFDLVGVLSAENITWLSTKHTDDFRGQWSVVFVQDGQLVVCRGDLVLCIPETDVRLLVRYDPETMYSYMKGLVDCGKKASGEGNQGKQNAAGQ